MWCDSYISAIYCNSFCCFVVFTLTLGFFSICDIELNCKFNFVNWFTFANRYISIILSIRTNLFCKTEKRSINSIITKCFWIIASISFFFFNILLQVFFFLCSFCISILRMSKPISQQPSILMNFDDVK